MNKSLIIFSFILNILFLSYALYNTNDYLEIKKDWERIITMIFVFFNIMGVIFTFLKYNKGFDIVHNLLFRGYYYLLSILFTSPLLIINSIVVLTSTVLSWRIFNDKCIFDLYTKYTDSKILTLDKNYLIVYIFILILKLHNIQNVYVTNGMFLINLFLYCNFIYHESKYLIK